MRIGYVYGFTSSPPRNGGSIHVYNLTRQLARLGCEVHTFDDEMNPACVSHRIDDESITRFLDIIDVLYVRIDGQSLCRNELKLRCLRAFAPRPIVWEINAPADERLAVLSPGARGSRGRSGIPLQAALRAKAARMLFTLRVAREERCRRRFATVVGAAVCVSDALRIYAERDVGIQRCEVIPNGSDPELFSLAEAQAYASCDGDGPFKVVYLGDFQWAWQGVDLIVDLARRARGEGRNIVFVVLTNSPLKTPLVEENVQVLTGISYFDVPTFLATADACLCLYRDYSWSRHGFYLSPLKLFDYMASAKPVIASRQGQIAEVIEDGADGLLVSSLDEAYRRIVFCLEHRDEARRLGERAREKVQRFYNWERAARATMEVFKTVVAA